jgi:hypothetical protein
MELQQHLFNRREVVVLLLDLDDETLGRTDYALPPPPTFSKNPSTSAAAATYVAPQTRLDVAREALIAFVGAKLRSAPTSSAMSFGLYAVRGEGRREEDVVELVSAATSSGAAGGRAVQNALKELNVGSYVYGTLDYREDQHPSGDKPVHHGSSSSSGIYSASAAPYGGVLHCLQQVLDAATQARQPAAASLTTPLPSTTADSPRLLPSQGNASFNTDEGLSTARGKENGRERGSNASGAGGAAAVVVHAIVVRSRGSPLPSLPTMQPAALTPLPPPSANSNACVASASTVSTKSVSPRVWLDVVVLDDSLEVSRQANAKGAMQPKEGMADGCRWALLDPVELTGIHHRGLALGPALVRVMSLPEGRSSGFISRIPPFLTILRSTVTSSDATFAASVTSNQSASPHATPPLIERISTVVIETPPAVAVRELSNPQSAFKDSTMRRSSTSRSGAPATAAQTSGVATTPSNGLLAMPVKAPIPSSSSSANPRTTLPCLASGSAVQSDSRSGAVTDVQQRPSSKVASGKASFRVEKAAAAVPSLPTVSQRKPSAPSSPLPTQQLSGKGRERCSSRKSSTNGDYTPSTGTAAGDEGAATKDVGSGNGLFVAHRYATSSPDTAALTARRDDESAAAILVRPLHGSVVAAAAAAAAPANGLPPSVGGRSPENSPGGGVRLPPSSSFSHGTAATNITARYLSVAATTQTPLSSTALRQQQQQQQQQQTTSASVEQTPHTLPNPHPPSGDGKGHSPPLLRQYSDADSSNSRKATGNLSAGTQRFTPPLSTNGTGRRVSAGPQISHASPSTNGTAAATTTATTVGNAPLLRVKQAVDGQKRIS